MRCKGIYFFGSTANFCNIHTKKMTFLRNIATFAPIKVY